MQYFRLSCVGFFLAFLAGCATAPQKYFPPPTDYVPVDQVQIKDRFSTVNVTRENLASEVNKCVPQLGADSQSVKRVLQEFPSRNDVGLGHASSANLFLLRQTTATCLQKSSEKYPIFAAEAFLETVNPQGVPPDEVEVWNRQIAKLVVTKGMAKVAYAFANGNAFVATYWVEPNLPQALLYSSSFKKAGTWETDVLDIKFSHPSLTSVSETKRAGAARKMHPLMHRVQ